MINRTSYTASKKNSLNSIAENTLSCAASDAEPSSLAYPSSPAPRNPTEASMQDQFLRTRMMYGNGAVEKLQNARVAIFGIGGVGGYVAESLVRTGVGAIDLVDHDVVDPTNLNRQIIATWSTVGKSKVKVMKQRLLDINPLCAITIHECFYLPQTADQFTFSEYDYIVDAVDTITAKIDLIMRAREAGTPIISAMGAGNKTDPTALRIADIYDTSVCPLARTMRKELRKRGVDHLKVAYSLEAPLVPCEPHVTQQTAPITEKAAPAEAQVRAVETQVPAEAQVRAVETRSARQTIPNDLTAKTSSTNPTKRRSTPGSNAFVPSAMGLVIGAEVVKDLIDW